MSAVTGTPGSSPNRSLAVSPLQKGAAEAASGVVLLVPSRTLSPSSHLIVTNTVVRNTEEALESRGPHAVPP